MRRILVTMLGVVMLALGPACGPVGAQEKSPADTPATKPGERKSAAKAPTAIITLEKGGEIVLEFWPDVAPRHVENFVKLASQKFYDGQRIHRVEPNFVVQFGDPQSKTLPLDDPRMGTGGPGYTIKAEFNKRSFDRGVLGMARTDDPNSAGSQIYIMLGPAHFLNGKYTAFGRVASGMGVVDQIRVGDRIRSIKIVN
jgi:peptidyl-prolyl cis-trans isomerase B (cyclophilin B)